MSGNYDKWVLLLLISGFVLNAIGEIKLVVWYIPNPVLNLPFPVLLIYMQGFLSRLQDVNDSLLNIREAVEDLPDQDGDGVKKLRRMADRMQPVSG